MQTKRIRLPLDGSLVLACVLLFLGALRSVAAESRANPGEEALVALVKKSGGDYSPEIRTAYLRQAEAGVMEALKNRKIALTPEQLEVIRQDPVLYDACYGTIYPADPRILLNLLELRQQLGPELFGQYRNLLVAGAVARRHLGVDRPMGEKEEWLLRSRAEAEQKSGKRPWPRYQALGIQGDQEAAGDTGQIDDEAEQEDMEAGEDAEGGDNEPQEATAKAPAAGKKKTPPARIVQKRREKWEKSQEKLVGPEGIEIIYRFLQEKQITPRQLYESGELKKELLAKMGAAAPESKTISYQLLEKVMTAKGLRPAERDPFPSLVEWCRYLDGIKPEFPIRTAPWPVLMPLAKGWPLREAQQIWANYQKSGKLQTYGKYQGKDKVIPLRLEPFPWHWQSWQGTYQAGGVCHEMSTIGLGSYMSVGVPTCKTGQPHHSCILVFSGKNGRYSVGTRQGTKGPEQTHSQWLFADPKAELPEIHHMGLALAMNQGLGEYLDSRIGDHLAGILKDRHENELARKMLISVLRRNPYNTEAWCELAGQPGGEDPVLHKARMIKLLVSLVESSADSVTEYREKATDVSLENEKDDDDAAGNPKVASSNYVRILGKMVLLPGLRPTADREVNRQALDLLKGCGGQGISLVEILPQFEVAVHGWETLAKPIADDVRRYIKENAGKSGKETDKGLAENLSGRIHAVASAAEGEQAVAWLKDLERIAAAKMVNRNRPRSGKVYADTVYKTVVDCLAAKLRKSGQEAEAKALEDRLAATLAKTKGK